MICISHVETFSSRHVYSICCTNRCSVFRRTGVLSLMVIPILFNQREDASVFPFSYLPHIISSSNKCFFIISTWTTREHLSDQSSEPCSALLFPLKLVFIPLFLYYRPTRGITKTICKEYLSQQKICMHVFCVSFVEWLIESQLYLALRRQIRKQV